jgi:hypothetical protein
MVDFIEVLWGDIYGYIWIYMFRDAIFYRIYMEYLGNGSKEVVVAVAISLRIPYFPCVRGRGSLQPCICGCAWSLSLLLTSQQPNLARPVIVALFQIACKIPDRVDL